MAAPQWHGPLVERLDVAETSARTVMLAGGGGTAALEALVDADRDIAAVMTEVAERATTPDLLRRLLTIGARAVIARADQVQLALGAHRNEQGWPDQAAVDAVDVDEDDHDDVERQALVGAPVEPTSVSGGDVAAAVDVAAPVVPGDAEPLTEWEQELLADAELADQDAADREADDVQDRVDPVAEAQTVVWDLYLPTEGLGEQLAADVERHVAAAQLLADEVDEYDQALSAVREQLSLPHHPDGVPLAERRARTRAEVGDAIEQLHTGVDQIAHALGMQAGVSLAEVVAEAARLRALVDARAEPPEVS
ncbi:MAG: hypothetical protein HOV94_41165 [Saccharothrix sp.]|nr:hypothetical protein [Saccharothrix sp.]